MTLAELISLDMMPDTDGDTVLTGLTLDSRAVKAGFLFAALPGLTVNGRDFVPQAIANGAVAILTDAPLPGVDIPVLVHVDPAGELSRLAARFYPEQPRFIAAVTGTNGKSSTVDFLRQIWRKAGLDAASLGTLGVARGSNVAETGYTTPDAVALHRSLDELARDGVTHLAMEASSHGLKQKRMHGARVTLAAFTNLTQDHLDYHPDFDDYFASKMKLFLELTPPGMPAIINVDSEWGERVADQSRTRGLKVTTVGWNGADWRVLEITPRASSQTVRVQIDGQTHVIELPLVGEFQTANAIGAAAMAVASGVDQALAIEALGELTGVAGRLEEAARTTDGVPVLVDFAHTPDGLDKLIRSVRPHTRGRIIIVFGCGGDRDPTKRAPMGQIAAKLADVVIVTDDNPRSEDPATVRTAIMKGCPDAQEVGDRLEAIRRAVAEAKAGDTILLAGKGHETGQKIGDRVLPFDDREAARRVVSESEAAS